MKKTIQIRDVEKDDAGPQLWAKLFALVPESRSRPYSSHIFDCSLSADDPRAPAVFRALTEAGWNPAWTGDSTLRRFGYGMGHIYDDSDFERCELLQLLPGGIGEIVLTWWDPDGTLRVQHDYLVRQAKKGLVSGTSTEALVSTPVRAQLETANLRHVVFRRTLLCVEGGRPGADGKLQYPLLPWSDVPGGPWWELTSDVVLPRLTARTPLEDDDGGPVKPDYSTGCRRAPVDFEVQELHYARSDLNKVPPFDIALSHEHWGSGGNISKFGWDQGLMVSHKFHRFIRDKKLPAHFWPVVIDEDL